jgi:RNA polymerase sigma factor (sigma-70 family)
VAVGVTSKGKTGNGILATLAAPGVSATARSRPDVTDHDLVQAVRAGDDHAFERLYHRYHRRISAYIFGMVHDHGRAEDLTQEVFVSALRRMRQTDRPIAFKPWVYEIAKNACIDAFRRTRRTEEVSIDAEEGLAPADHGKLASVGPSPDAAVEGKQQLDDLCGAFGGLSEAHHQILVMRELEGLSYREIGERLGMSRPSVESTLFRARRRLTEEYEELRTGERCLRIQGIIERVGASAAALGTRDQRRVGSHISHCQPCRRHAVMAGMDAAALGRRTVRGKLAAFLPLPAILRKRWFGGDGAGGDVAAAHAAHHAPALAQASMAAAQYGEPSMGGWMKLTAVATAVALAGVGAGAVDHVAGGGKHHDAPIVRAAPAAAAAQAPAAGGAATGGARQTIATATGATGSGHGSSGQRRKATGGASGSSGAKGFSGGGAAGGSGGGAASPSTGSSGGGRSESASSASTGSGGGTSTASKPSSGGGAVQQAAGAVTGAVGTVTDTATGATGGGSSAPLVDPNLGALTQPSSNPPPESAGQVVSGTTDVVGNTVGGQAGDAVKQTGAAVGSTVDNVTQGVTGAVSGLLGGK